MNPFQRFIAKVGQAPLAKQLKTTQAAVSLWATGKCVPTPRHAQTLMRLSTEAGMPLAFEDIYDAALNPPPKKKRSKLPARPGSPRRPKKARTQPQENVSVGQADVGQDSGA